VIRIERPRSRLPRWTETCLSEHRASDRHIGIFGSLWILAATFMNGSDEFQFGKVGVRNRASHNTTVD
jgi:hypothetical protein